MPIKRLVNISFALITLLLAPPNSAQALLRCDTTAASARYRFDIVPCVEEGRDSPITDSKSSADATKQAEVLIAWIVTQTHWTEHGMPPIRMISRSEIKRMFNAEALTDFNVEALYSNKDHTLYLPDTWRPSDLRDRSILLHELVHHLQYLNGVKAACPSELDWQALHLQIDWLGEQGVEDPFKLIGINALFLLMLRQCNPA